MFIGYQVTVVAREILSHSGVTGILEFLFADVVGAFHNDLVVVTRLLEHFVKPTNIPMLFVC